jgi:hypothetical protein
MPRSQCGITPFVSGTIQQRERASIGKFASRTQKRDRNVGTKGCRFTVVEFGAEVSQIQNTRNNQFRYIIEIRRLEDERKSLKMEKEHLAETFDMKLRRAQSLYETQLQTGTFYVQILSFMVHF